MPLPVRSRSLRTNTTSNVPNEYPAPSSREVSPTKQPSARKPTTARTTDERIEAARQRRVSLAGKKEEDRNVPFQANAERKPSAPPSSFKTPARPVRRNSENKQEPSARRSSTSRPSSTVENASSTPLSRSQSLSSRARKPAEAGRPVLRPPSTQSRPTNEANSSKHRRSSSVAAPRSEITTSSHDAVRAAVRAAVTTPAQPSKPAFNTNQQSFTTAKKLPHHDRAKSTAQDLPPAPSMESLEAQANLLRLWLLHSSFDATHKRWTASAYEKLHARFVTLQKVYVQSLRTARSTRQARNLLALHQWCNGNEAVLMRRLDSLSYILSELCELTRGDVAWQGSEDARSRGWWVENEELEGIGEYTRLVRVYEGWVAWVEEVWAARDKIREVENLTVESPPLTPVKQTVRQPEEVDEETERLADTELEGIGDAFKGTLRSLGTIVDRIIMRLDELRDPEIPIPRKTSKEGEEAPAIPAPDDPVVGPVPTPKVLVDITWKLTAGMREELQLMREIEFEVTIGEKAWKEQKVRQIGADLIGGFSTPLPLR